MKIFNVENVNIEKEKETFVFFDNKIFSQIFDTERGIVLLSLSKFSVIFCAIFKCSNVQRFWNEQDIYPLFISVLIDYQKMIHYVIHDIANDV